MFGLWMVKPPMRGVLRCAIVDSGVLSVNLMIGVMQKLELFAVNLDSHLLVRSL